MLVPARADAALGFKQLACGVRVAGPSDLVLVAHPLGMRVVQDDLGLTLDALGKVPEQRANLLCLVG